MLGNATGRNAGSRANTRHKLTGGVLFLKETVEMKINGLKVKNIKIIKIVEIHPDKLIVKLSGKNGAGKSTIMDTISYAVGSKRFIPDIPIRKGEDNAEIVVELDDMTATRKFRLAPGGGYTTSLTLMGKDGTTYSKPQEILDKIIGQLSFDPFAFSLMSPKEQADLLKEMVDLGINLYDWQANYIELFDKRRDEKRERDRLQSVFTSRVKHDGVSPVDVSDLTEKLKAANSELHKYNEGVNKLLRMNGEIAAAEYAVLDAEGFVKNAEEALAKAKRELDTALLMVKERKQKVLELQAKKKDFVIEVDNLGKELPDIKPIEEAIANAGDINEKVRQNIEYRKAEIQLADSNDKVAVLEKKLTAHVDMKEKAIKSAKYPVKGLEFHENLLLFNGTPLAEASSGQKIRISAMIGMALNPDLKVLFIRNASLINKENFKILTEVAAEKDYQMWCEYMDETGEIGIYLEDGEIVGEVADNG